MHAPRPIPAKRAFLRQGTIRMHVSCVWITLELPGSLPVWTSFRGKECCHFAYCVARRAHAHEVCRQPPPPPTPHLFLVHECRSIKERMIDEDLRNRKLAYLAAHNSWKREVCSPLGALCFAVARIFCCAVNVPSTFDCCRCKRRRQSERKRWKWSGCGSWWRSR
jgi:hypothetical protein